MKQIFLLLSVALTLFLTGCKKDGTELFWTNAVTYGTITVNVDGEERTITEFYNSYDPTCSSGGCAKFLLSPGKYTFTAHNANNTATWNGSFTVSNDGCGKFLLQ